MKKLDLNELINYHPGVSFSLYFMAAECKQNISIVGYFSSTN